MKLNNHPSNNYLFNYLNHSHIHKDYYYFHQQYIKPNHQINQIIYCFNISFHLKNQNYGLVISNDNIMIRILLFFLLSMQKSATILF
jgi:hypothetical protein